MYQRISKVIKLVVLQFYKENLSTTLRFPEFMDNFSKQPYPVQEKLFVNGNFSTKYLIINLYQSSMHIHFILSRSDPCCLPVSMYSYILKSNKIISLK